ncbi:MAG TPA: hypothetical protein VLJ37_11805 [bacterium]|nr:hypothetical protein [bacterium]
MPTPLHNLMISMRQAVLTTNTPSFAAALTGVLEAHEALEQRLPDSCVDRSLQTMTNSLSAFAGSDMDRITPASWTTAASALHAAGHLVSRRGETPASTARVNDLFLAASDFLLFTGADSANRRRLKPKEVFLQDRLLADTVLTLKGWWNPGSFQPEAMQPLGALLVRVGIASGLEQWADLPNLAGAVWTFFEGADLEDLAGARLLKPSSYFQAAAAWRPGSLGYAEQILASALDGDPLNRTVWLAKFALNTFRDDEALARIQEHCLEFQEHGWSRRDLVDGLAEIGSLFYPASSRKDVNLPAFIEAALKAVH